MICIICGKEFKTNRNWQICCSKECSKINRKERRKEYYQKHRKEILKQKKEYQEKHKDEHKKYRQSRKEKIKIIKKIYQQSPQGKKIYKKSNKKYIQTPKGRNAIKRHRNNRRNLSFYPLNEYFKGSDGHHIDRINVIYIPKELHKSISHDLHKNINMNVINLKAWNFLESNSY